MAVAAKFKVTTTWNHHAGAGLTQSSPSFTAWTTCVRRWPVLPQFKVTFLGGATRCAVVLTDQYQVGRWLVNKLNNSTGPIRRI